MTVGFETLAGMLGCHRFGGLPPYRETQAYVGRVLKLYSEHQREAGAASPVAVPAEWKPQPARIRGSGEGS